MYSRKGARGKVIGEYKSLYFVEFIGYKDTIHYLFVEPSKVEVVENKSNFIGE